MCLVIEVRWRIGIHPEIRMLMKDKKKNQEEENFQVQTNIPTTPGPWSINRPWRGSTRV